MLIKKKILKENCHIGKKLKRMSISHISEIVKQMKPSDIAGRNVQPYCKPL